MLKAIGKSATTGISSLSGMIKPKESKLGTVSRSAFCSLSAGCYIYIGSSVAREC